MWDGQGAPPSVVIDDEDGGYKWLEMWEGAFIELRAPTSVDMSYARGTAAKVEAQIKSGMDAAMEWDIDPTDMDEDEGNKEVRDLVLAVTLARRIGRAWNVKFKESLGEIAAFDQVSLIRFFKNRQPLEGFWFHVMSMGAVVRPDEGNAFAVEPISDTDPTAAAAKAAL